MKNIKLFIGDNIDSLEMDFDEFVSREKKINSNFEVIDVKLSMGGIPSGSKYGEYGLLLIYEE